jgi:hypothetical protein
MKSAKHVRRRNGMGMQTHTKCECRKKTDDDNDGFKHFFTRTVYNEVAHPNVFIEMWDAVLIR